MKPLGIHNGAFGTDQKAPDPPRYPGIQLSKENLHVQLEQLTASLKQAEEMRAELDRRVFHLKTLYDVSKDIHGSVEIDAILRSFLLMSMGNFGVVTGFIMLMNVELAEIERFITLGIHDTDSFSFRTEWQKILKQKGLYDSMTAVKDMSHSESFLSPITLTLPFILDDNTMALLGLGAKLAGDIYSQDDKELLYTLLNNLSVAVKNARSFEQIRRLNLNLEAKNVELSTALNELKESLRKIEILESIKANLSKFVPAAVTRLIEKAPAEAFSELQERDLSVLFLDIGGYTGLCERLGHAVVHDIIEKHFSVFMDAIYANNGDVNETAGDGLMVLFMHENPETNALEAVRAALAIKERTARISREFSQLYRPLDVNMGINSGTALVGAAKFESLIGSRWTYTARGTLTNVAARISALGSKGTLLMSGTTAGRVKNLFSPMSRGMHKLKNVSEEVEVFELK
jgi:class 3 adenylate cyclase